MSKLIIKIGLYGACGVNLTTKQETEVTFSPDVSGIERSVESIMLGLIKQGWGIPHYYVTEIALRVAEAYNKGLISSKKWCSICTTPFPWGGIDVKVKGV